METIRIEVGDRIKYCDLFGTVMAIFQHGTCMVKLDTGDLVAAPLAELKLIEKHKQS
jgi:hypothetical protein